MSDKMIEEEELKGLEKEIDAAVDRLFVEKGGKPLRKVSAEPPLPGPFQETKKEVEWETVSPISLTPAPSNPLEKLETKLLLLEWEISKENLTDTVAEVLALHKHFGKSPDISTLLDRMVRVLNFMIQNEEAIQPHLIRFLLDSKETIQLLMKEESGENIPIYKKLAYKGIEARFSCLQELQEGNPKPSSVLVGWPDQKKELSLTQPELSDEMMKRLEILSGNLSNLVEKIDRHLSAHEKSTDSPGIQQTMHESPLKTKVTIFKTGEGLFGVESDRVLKLFRVPSPLFERIGQLKKFKLKGLTVRMVNLKDFFSIDGEGPEEEKQVLILKGDEEVKGVMIDKVLHRLAGPLEQAGEFNEYLLGMMRWTYQGLPIRVPILDFQKL